MGLFDKFVKGVANEVAKGAKGALGDAIEKATGIDIDGSDSRVDNTTHSTVTSSPEVFEDDGLHTKEAFLEVLNNELNDYTIKTDVSTATIGGVGRTYDVGIYKGSKLVGLVALVEHNKANKAYHDSMESAKRANIPFINFFLHMRNEKNYVVSRIKKAIS